MGSEHTSAVQSGPESSESETSEYSDVLFLSSDFTLVKIPEEEFVKKRTRISHSNFGARRKDDL